LLPLSLTSDIEPSREWQMEIELALRSMNALAAFITSEFHESFRTDQEVGWALGRGVLVLPIRLGSDPYGVMGKFQGITGNLEQPNRLAELIAKTLIINPQSHGDMRRALIHAFVNASSAEMATSSCRMLENVSDATEEEKILLWEACATNSHVASAGDVQKTIYELFGPPPTKNEPVIDNRLPF
jgi:hypothetical protein